MFNKTFKTKHVYIILIAVVILWIGYTFTYRENFIKEHFEDADIVKIAFAADDAKKGVENVNNRINETDKRVNENTKQIGTLRSDFDIVTKKMEAQGQQAQAAQASLQSISNTGVNNVMPL